MKDPFITDHVHYRAFSLQSMLITENVDYGPYSLQSTFVTDHVQNIPRSLLIMFIKDHFSQQTTFHNRPCSYQTTFIEEKFITDVIMSDPIS